MQLTGKELPFNEVVVLVREEPERANKKFPLFHSKHHGYAVILEELEEMWDEIKRQEPNTARVQAECIQFITMGFKFLMSPIFDMKD